MKKAIEISLLSLLLVLLGCNDNSYGEKELLYESVSIEYRIKEIVTLDKSVFNGRYDNKDHNSPIMVHAPIESKTVYSSVFYFPQDIYNVKTSFPMINANGEPEGREYKLKSSNSGYQIFAEFSMKVKNAVDGNLSDIS